MPDALKPKSPRRPLQGWLLIVLLLVVWAVLYLPGLGGSGLTNTEGHRAVPGFELLTADDPNWLTPTLYERVYLRKPPGMAWMVAASASIFGMTEFAARIISAFSVLVASLVSARFASLWFGPRAPHTAALSAGLATLLLPVLWIHGRVAELEAPMFAATLLASLSTLHLLLIRPSGRASGWAALGVFVGVLVLLFIKGPAGLPAVGGAMIASIVVGRSWRPLVHRVWLIPFCAGVGLFGAYLLVAGRSLPDDALTQSPGEFLWSVDRLGGVALLAPSALLMGLPATLALLFPWGPDARSEPLASEPGVLLMSRSLAWATLATIGLFVLAGVSNPRYALPALVFAPVLVGGVVAGMPAMTPRRAMIARLMLLGRAWVLPCVLLVAGVAHWAWFEQRSRSASGKEAGQQIAGLVPAGGVVMADHAIEARPEVLWELVRADARVVWSPLDGAPGEAWLLVRDDGGSDELTAQQRKRATVGRWRVHGFEMVLLSPEG